MTDTFKETLKKTVTAASETFATDPASREYSGRKPLSEQEHRRFLHQAGEQAEYTPRKPVLGVGNFEVPLNVEGFRVGLGIYQLEDGQEPRLRTGWVGPRITPSCCWGYDPDPIQEAEVLREISRQLLDRAIKLETGQVRPVPVEGGE